MNGLRMITVFALIQVVALTVLAILVTCSISRAQDRAAIESYVIAVSYQHGLDPELVLAIIETESKFNTTAVGAKYGEVGLMQLRPKYFPTATFDYRNNINLGVQYLAQLKERKEFNYGCAWFVAYNVGPSRPLKNPRDQTYFKKVMSTYKGGNYCEKYVAQF
jgi:soluble lytic murein transglycosylase-like protein